MWINSPIGNIKTKNTTPELIVRRLLHKLGYRLHLHKKDLPSSPDIVLPKHKKIIFVNECFWHGHESCKK
ncbi:very short patch repair endonuclease [Paenibacillus sp. MY03]|uniref:very short patch repair endonuclease n=1 Tax=Paenibacillus sp. MY03 TaxID=302980 RepID=UPI001C4EFE0F